MQPLLAQVPLTVSPFISIPSAVTLPYTFKSVPTSMPPSLLAEDESGEKPRFIVSPGGHAAHPDEIVVACQNLRSHLQKSAEDAQRSLKDWEESVKQRDLAEKRRVAPGWLDRDEKILEPTRAEGGRDGGDNLIDGSSSDTTGNPSMPAMSPSREGEEIDRAFGKLGLK